MSFKGRRWKAAPAVSRLLATWLTMPALIRPPGVGAHHREGAEAPRAR
jgi:hypothetical protein